jgi:hypothetical protein
VSLDDLAIALWRGSLWPEDMPGTAARLLAAGYDTPALRRAAGHGRHDDPRDIRDEFRDALIELGAWLADDMSARKRATVLAARDVRAGRISPAGCAGRVRRLWNFDDVVYGVVPAELREFVRVCLLHGEGCWEDDDLQVIDAANPITASA